MIFEMQIQVSPVPKSWIIEEYEKCEQLTEEMKERMTEYLLSLHGIKENSKHEYLSKIKKLGVFLFQRGIVRFEDFLNQASRYWIFRESFNLKELVKFLKGQILQEMGRKEREVNPSSNPIDDFLCCLY
jgi:hypothetical protein